MGKDNKTDENYGFEQEGFEETANELGKAILKIALDYMNEYEPKTVDKRERIKNE